MLSVLGHMDRSPDGILNGGLVAAKFDHATSRNIDPQLHSHVFVLNVVRTEEGDAAPQKKLFMLFTKVSCS